MSISVDMGVIYGTTNLMPCFKSNWTYIQHRFNTGRSLRWRHNGRDSVSNHQPHHCLLNCLFRCRLKKTSKLRVTGRCVGSSPGPVNSPHKWPVTRKMFDDVIMWNLRVPDLQKKCSDFTRIRGYLNRGRPSHMINPYINLTTWCSQSISPTASHNVKCLKGYEGMSSPRRRLWWRHHIATITISHYFPFVRESSGLPWIPLTKAQLCEACMSSSLIVETNFWTKQSSCRPFQTPWQSCDVSVTKLGIEKDKLTQRGLIHYKDTILPV